MKKTTKKTVAMTKKTAAPKAAKTGVTAATTGALIQTRVPAGLFRWVQAEAKRTHTKVASWLRLRLWDMYEAGQKRK